MTKAEQRKQEIETILTQRSDILKLFQLILSYPAQEQSDMIQRVMRIFEQGGGS